MPEIAEVETVRKEEENGLFLKQKNIICCRIFEWKENILLKIKAMLKKNMNM